MSRSSDIAIVRNPANGRFNFAWSKADVVFDDTREHEVMSRLTERRAQWWADATGAHGSRDHEIKYRNASTRSGAEASAREALAGMVKQGDITIEKVVVTLPPPGAGTFQRAVYWSVPSSRQRTRVATTLPVAPSALYTPANPAQWALPLPMTIGQAIDRLAYIIFTYVLDGSSIPLAGSYLWQNPQPTSIVAELDRIASALFVAVLDSTPISTGTSYAWANPQPSTDQDRVDRLASVVYADVYDGSPIP